MTDTAPLGLVNNVNNNRANVVSADKFALSKPTSSGNILNLDIADNFGFSQ